MVTVGINSMKEVVIGITEKLGNGWQIISTVIKSNCVNAWALETSEMEIILQNLNHI